MSMMQRLKTDFELTIISFFGGCAALGILPFAAYRLLRGEYLLGAFDLLIVAAIGAVVLSAWRSGNTARAGLCMALINTVGCIAITVLFGRHGLLWVYVVIVTNFFLTTRQKALAASVVILLILSWRHEIFASRLEMVSFLVTSSLVTAYTLIFAWRTAHQREQLELLATHDSLTAVGNRRLLEIELAHAVEVWASRQQPAALAIFDLDHFKQVNDRHGHKVGDRVLRDFASIVRANCRKSDRLFRLGGEEFVLLLPDTASEGLDAALLHLHQAVRKRLKGPSGPVHVSIGAALLQTGESWESWLARADAALYAAKRGGRNRAVVDGQPLQVEVAAPLS